MEEMDVALSKVSVDTDLNTAPTVIRDNIKVIKGLKETIKVGFLFFFTFYHKNKQKCNLKSISILMC